MRDTRAQRNALVIGLTAAIGAVIGQMIVQPILEQKVKK